MLTFIEFVCQWTLVLFTVGFFFFSTYLDFNPQASSAHKRSSGWEGWLGTVSLTLFVVILLLGAGAFDNLFLTQR